MKNNLLVDRERAVNHLRPAWIIIQVVREKEQLEFGEAFEA